MSVLGVAGAVAGFFIGGPSGAALGYSIGSGVDAIVNAPDRVGPRLEDLRVQMSQYGATIPFEWGCNRHAGTIIWPKILEAVEHKEEESSKGGPETITYKYTLSCAVLLCEGPIAGVRRIWANKKIVYDVSEENTGPTQDPRVGAIRFHLGAEDQGPDPLIEATDGPGPAYRGYAYVVFEDYDVTDLNGRPPQWEFEVITNGSKEVEPATTFGEAYGLTPDAPQYDSLFGADIDKNGHIWLHTMSGHARINPETGDLVISASTPPTPQIQEYDGATGELLWFYNVQPLSERWSPNLPPYLIYPIQGAGLYSGGYYFIGRGQPGFPSSQTDAASYAHGVAVNTRTHAVEVIFNQCSSNQFQNGFYWPSIPIPLLDNNKVYFSSGGGLEDRLGVGFMPASIAGTNGSGDIDPVPDYAAENPVWNVPAGWAQARQKAPCPVHAPGGPPLSFDGTGVQLPGAALKSTSIKNPDAVIVQGGSSLGGSYLAFIAHSPRPTGFDLSAPSSVLTCQLPGSSVIMPPFAWDPLNNTIWAFAGAGGSNSVLYAITAGGTGAGSEGGLTATSTGFTMPVVPGQAESNDVKGMIFDETTGKLRIIRGVGSNSYAALFDPLTGTISDEVKFSGASSTPGKMWSLPRQNRVIYADGYRLINIPSGPRLAPDAVQLGLIVADICKRSGLADNDIDVSDLIDPVDGYIVPRQMTARTAIEPLQQAFFFDAVESDDRIKFVKRGVSTTTVIPLADRAAHEGGQEVPDALTITRAFELELPVQCDVEYPDIEADHLIGNQSDRRITKDTRHNLNLQLPIVMTADKAKSVARTLLYEAWQNQTFKFMTSRKYAHLEPTSIVELPTASASYRGRITAKREQPNGIIEWEARLDSVTVYTQTGEGAAPTNYVPQTIFQPSATYLAMLDIPLLRDQDEDAGFYVAMGGA